MRKTRLFRLQVGAILITAFGAAACNSGTAQSQGGQSRTSATVPARASDPLAQHIASPPAGFTSEPTDAHSRAAHTGAQTYAEAAPALCNFALPNTGGRQGWVASQLRYFDKNPTYPSVWLEACVTQMRSQTYAKTNASRDAEVLGYTLGPPLSFLVAGVPSATGLLNNFTLWFWVTIIFSKGPYYTVISAEGTTTQGNERSEVTAVKQIAINWAVAEYHLLPT
jgi:hypothetical protein